jgi:predicted amino acid-binding ACT domain protein
MKQFATLTIIGRDKTGVIARVTNFLLAQKANIETRDLFENTRLILSFWRGS